MLKLDDIKPTHFVRGGIRDGKRWNSEFANGVYMNKFMSMRFLRQFLKGRTHGVFIHFQL